MVPLCQFSVGRRRGRLLTGLGWWLIAVIWKLSSSHVGLWKKCHMALAGVGQWFLFVVGCGGTECMLWAGLASRMVVDAATGG